MTAANLPRAARVLAVADEYDELVRGTQGRAPMTSDDALAALANASARFDAACVAALREALAGAAAPSLGRVRGRRGSPTARSTCCALRRPA